MSIKTICGYEELLPPDFPRRDGYVRSLSDPIYLICCRTGQVYIRADGQPWEWPAWEITREAPIIDKTTGLETRPSIVTQKSSGAWFDSKRYSPRVAASA